MPRAPSTRRTRPWRSPGRWRSPLFPSGTDRTPFWMTNFPVFAYEMPALRRGCEPAIHRSGHRTSVQLVPDRRPAGRSGDLVSAARAGLHELLAGTNRGLRATRQSVQRRLRLLQFVFKQLASPCGELRRRGSGSIRARRGIPCLGIEPTASTACAARNIGIEVVQDFFGVSLAESLVVAGRSADLTV